MYDYCEASEPGFDPGPESDCEFDHGECEGCGKEDCELFEGDFGGSLCVDCSAAEREADREERDLNRAESGYPDA
jgi:hypothetical protein